MMKNYLSIDGNYAAAHASYAFTEVAAIYPITPSSTMAELVDTWSMQQKKNMFGSSVKVVEMQSEGGAAGAVHGVVQAGTLATTYTASQGLLLMIPNLYKWVGENQPAVLHVSARSIAARSLSIFGDHQDIYACRQSGVCMLASHSVQECNDLGAVAHLSAIKASLPFIHFFDGFRTSHEIQKIEVMDYDEYKELIDSKALENFRKRGMDPHYMPTARGGAENDDTYFQAKEAQNLRFEAVADIVNDYMQKITEKTGRHYAPFTYYGDPEATRVIIAMGSVTETTQEVVDALNAKGERVGLVKVHLYRPFSVKYLKAVIPSTVEKIAVLDRTKEPGALGEPLYLDVRTALLGYQNIKMIIGGRYGLSSKDTQPNQIKAVYDHLLKEDPHHSFTIGIEDDVTHLSLPVDPDFRIKSDATSCLFYGLGSDGTVSANKSSIKIIGDHTDLKIQAYFAYDSKKAGSTTRSYLRFGKSPIRSAYYVDHADFISCSLDSYLLKFDMLRNIKQGGTFLLNTTFSKDEIEDRLPNRFKVQLAKKNVNFYIINATDIAMSIGMGRHTNTILQSAFFALNEQIIPYSDSLEYMKEEAYKAYSKKGQEVVELNYRAIDLGKEGLVKIDVKSEWADLKYDKTRALTGDEYFDTHVAPISALEGNDLPVSHFAKGDFVSGHIPANSSFKEHRNIATQVPKWNSENCIQCGFCSFVCPHATIRIFLLDEDEIQNAPREFTTIPAMGKGVEHLRYRVQISADNCVGCGLCATECPGKGGKKALTMVDVNTQEHQNELANYLFKETEYKSGYFPTNTIKGTQLLYPYFEVPGACPGCGETPYYRLASQLFGRDMMIANATGCTSIYCGSSPSTPFCTDKNGEGMVWANSLFEDNAEFGFGMKWANLYKSNRIHEIMEETKNEVEGELAELFQEYQANIGNREVERKLAPKLVELLKVTKSEAAKELLKFERDLVSKSVWIIGGDGWAYDIGYGGLDHVLANDLNVNILVLDTEVYSNTGGQSSKSSQAASIAKFTAGGKGGTKKDLGQIAMAYGHVYVASIAMGANRMQTIKAMIEAESYEGPSLILAYSPCEAHGIKGGLSNHQKVQKAAVECGYVSLYRYDPRNVGKELVIDSAEPKWEKFREFLMNETRFAQLPSINPDKAEELLTKTETDAKKRYERLVKLAG
ncbi:MAG: pyruvate:ferredoxin (flavodoxin) oxidoreductase [Erysipelotrichaceae bacterium]|nr:pyruvate:ferredoxin (flavodoxin) oxidoreductase [Erysipelotrichaceae bacterium]